ncbi:MAG TPA: hypothetical protein VFT12_11090 [Thermoanaerobaculia bacterium]|nr:hypothetical protein [Thermoanaerobaculia bacterium]
MVAFTQSVHQRPFALLLEELPALASLSDTKFNLATKVLRRRFRTEPGVDQTRMRELGAEIASGVVSPFTAQRIREIFEFDKS